MVRRILCVVLAALILAAGAPPSFADDLDDVKRLMARGAYREALRELEVLRAKSPNDPWVAAYRELVEKRLREPSEFVPQSDRGLEMTREALAREEQAQLEAREARKREERRLKDEQARWSAELKRLTDETAKTRELAQQEDAKREAERRRKEQDAIRAARRTEQEAATRKAAEQDTARQPAPVTPEPAPSVPEASSQLTPPTSRLDEAEPPVAEEGEAVSRPVGSAQIFADQLIAAPERALATAEGNVRVIFDDGELRCDRMTFFTDTKDLYAQGHVRLERGEEIIRGEMVHYNTETKKGRVLEGTAYRPPWYEHGRVMEHIAEGVMRVRPGYLTSCEFDPPHFRLQGRQATVFASDKLARARNVMFVVEKLPIFFFPWMVFADRQSPFYLIPGKKKPWGAFALMGYKYEWPAGQKGDIHLDWRRNFGWGVGVDHTIDTPQLGKGLLRLYYNEQPNQRRPLEDLPKGAEGDRYRALWRHKWQPMDDTTVVTDLKEYSDVDFRRELLFREEYVDDDQSDSFVSLVTNAPNYTLSGLVRKRLNRYQTVTESLPELAIDVKPNRIGETQFFAESKMAVANLETKNAHSENDLDAVRVDWFEQVSYAMNWFRPVLLTPRAGVRQTYYNKDRQGADRHDMERDLISGQFTGGTDASLKLFRIFPVVTNRFGLDLNMLRHVVTPTVSYSYIHEPTITNSALAFPSASDPSNVVTFGFENKLQTRRPKDGDRKKLQSVDLARFLVSLPYTFHGSGNEQGGRLGSWEFDLELYPWQWMRLETDWTIQSIYARDQFDTRFPDWNTDLVLVGGRRDADAHTAGEVRAPLYRAFEAGPTGLVDLMPYGQWYLGFGHRYSRNDKTEDVLQWNWALSEKWEIGTFHRFTWKEVAGGAKRFRNVREVQYTLRRDLHDWIGEVVYRVDREFGEELFLTLTLKAYPTMPVELETSYHQPKLGSQSSPFSPVR